MVEVIGEAEAGPEAVGVVAEDLLHTPGGGVRLMREGGEGGAGHPGIRRETPPMTEDAAVLPVTTVTPAVQPSAKTAATLVVQ
jgi:hypothetical protein